MVGRVVGNLVDLTVNYRDETSERFWHRKLFSVLYLLAYSALDSFFAA